MYRPDHSAHTSATVHHDDRVQFLVVGDETSLTVVEAELAMLPLCARGRVFVEVAEPEQIVPLAAPIRMTVTWLVRSHRSGRPGTAEPCDRGGAAMRAVRAWTAEMLCDGPGCTRAVATGSWALVTEMREHLEHEVGMACDAIVEPTPY